MVLLLLETRVRDEHREVTVLHAELLDLVVEPVYGKPRCLVSHCPRHTLDRLPDGVRPRSQNVTTRDVVVVEHLSLDQDLTSAPVVAAKWSAHISVPSREVLLLLVLDSHLVQVLILLHRLRLSLTDRAGVSSASSSCINRGVITLHSRGGLLLRLRGGRARLDLLEVDHLHALATLIQALKVRLDVASLQQDRRARARQVHGVLLRRLGNCRVEDQVKRGRDRSREREGGDIVFAASGWNDLLDEVLRGQTELLELEMRAEGAGGGLGRLGREDQDRGRGSGFGGLRFEEELLREPGP